MAVEHPAWGQLRAAKELAQRGMPISAAGVRGVWKRQGLENLTNRRRAVEAKVARESHMLPEAPLAALENAKGEKEAHGEGASDGPGYCGAQDPFDGGTLKGVGRLSPHPFIETYRKGAWAKLYDRTTSLTAADLLNDPVLPFLEEHELPLPRILTDRGTEYCGSPDSHEDELYLALENIDHTRTKLKRPQTNGIVERLHKTMLNEVYRIPLRKKIDASLTELQTDLEEWIRSSNEERGHPGRWCYGRTPKQTFIEMIPLAKEKVVAA